MRVPLAQLSLEYLERYPILVEGQQNWKKRHRLAPFLASNTSVWPTSHHTARYQVERPGGSRVLEAPLLRKPPCRTSGECLLSRQVHEAGCTSGTSLRSDTRIRIP